MADLEGGHFGLVYEYRDPCNVIALVQLCVTVLSFFFTYPVWWAGLFGVIVAGMGYYGSAQPTIQSKTSFIQFYYFGNCFMFVLQIFSAVILMVLVTEWDEFDLGAWLILIVGTLCLGLQIAVTYVAIQRSQSFRAELMRNPPASENLYGSAANPNNVYSAMGASGSTVKTI